MSRHVFYSLHYDRDRARAELVRKLAGLVPNNELKPNEWATLRRTGDFAFKRWFEQQTRGRSCTIVLIGAETTTREWVRYEIARSWQLGLGLLGVHIHNLLDDRGTQSSKGEDPFAEAGLGANAALVRTYDPPEQDGKLAYRFIADNLARWVEDAVATRKAQP
ncbi:MAG TPA: TIR domain-containing protein [Polyangiales bacterium]|nr:TIR domain-containing protein [Polyangiales bacterium]